MKLMTKAIEAQMPNSEQKDPIAYVKYFVPWGSWSWYGTEYDPNTRIMFGLVFGHEAELGSWCLDELEEVTGPGGIKIERDLHFKPKPLSECTDPCGVHENPL